MSPAQHVGRANFVEGKNAEEAEENTVALAELRAIDT
jgi:hypothetical protein